MFLTAHSTAGVVIGSGLANPFIAFLSGLISHFLLDIIPHGDENFGENGKVKTKFLAKLGAIDIFLMAVNLSALFYVSSSLFTLSVISAILGAVLPDFVMGAYRLTENTRIKPLKHFNKILAPLEDFHHYCHFNIIKYELPLPAGLILQAAVLALSWSVLK